MDAFDYSTKSDDELCRLFIEREELRSEARRALEEELGRRHRGAEEVARIQEEDARDQAAALRQNQKKATGSFGRLIRDGGKTLHWWTAYKRQTGRWPWSSIAIHVMNWVVILLGGLFLIWLAGEWHLSRWQFFGLFVLVSVPYLVLEEWAKYKVKLNLLRNGRRLAKQSGETRV